MAVDKDINDVFDDIVLSEEAQHKDSYEEGFQAGQAAGNPEGFHLGYHRGAELGKELGYYLGVVSLHLTSNEASEIKLSEKIVSQLKKVKDLIDAFPRTNSEDHDIMGGAEIIRAQFKKCCALLKIPSNNPFDSKVSF